MFDAEAAFPTRSRRAAILAGLREIVEAEPIPPRVVRDARSAFLEDRDSQPLKVSFDSTRGSPDAPGSQTRALIFIDGGPRLLVYCSRVPGGTLLTGRFLGATWPDAIYLHRPTIGAVALRTLTHGGFESDLVATGPAKLTIRDGTSAGGDGTTLSTDWITI